MDQVINIKSVPGYPVYGDGVTDDTANINAILSQYAGCKIIYFPAGTYIVTNTIFVPAGSRIFGDAYASAISAVGSNFWNPDAPTTMVQVGNAGDVGVAQISDMMFTVADVLQGCKLVRRKYSGAGESPLLTHVPQVEVNIAAALHPATSVSGTPTSASAALRAARSRQTAVAPRTSAKPHGA